MYSLPYQSHSYAPIKFPRPWCSRPHQFICWLQLLRESHKRIARSSAVAEKLHDILIIWLGQFQVTSARVHQAWWTCEWEAGEFPPSLASPIPLVSWELHGREAFKLLVTSGHQLVLFQSITVYKQIIWCRMDSLSLKQESAAQESSRRREACNITIIMPSTPCTVAVWHFLRLWSLDGFGVCVGIWHWATISQQT